MNEKTVRTFSQCIEEATVLGAAALDAKSAEERQRLLARALLWVDAAKAMALHGSRTSFVRAAFDA
jgi:hypothetical protein